MPPYTYDAHGRRVVGPTKGERREQAILEAAEAQLGEIGAEAMTVEGIATAVGITRGALYRYFRSRNDVLAALVRQTVAELHEEVDQLPGGDASPQELIRGLMERTEAMWREHGEVMRTAVELSPTVESVREAWADAEQAVAATVARIASRAGIPEDGSPTGASALTAALVVMTERSFYEASRDHQELAFCASTCTAVWLRALRLD